MECPVMDQGVDCQTRFDANTESIAIVGDHYRIGDCPTTGPGIFGSFHLVDLYSTIDLPRHAQTGYGWRWDGDEFQ